MMNGSNSWSVGTANPNYQGSTGKLTVDGSKVSKSVRFTFGSGGNVPTLSALLRWAARAGASGFDGRR